MLRTLRIGTVLTALVAVVSIAIFLYLTRGVAAPTEAIQIPTITETSNSEVVYRISQTDSQVTYTVQEVLTGIDKTVGGTTSQIAGDIWLNLNDPSQSQIGEIRIDARTFTTDDTHPDNAVVRFGLQSGSDANQYIVFQSTTIDALPSPIKVGDDLTVKLIGNLTIAGVTKEVTFNVTVSLKSQDQLTATAQFTLQPSAFNLSILNAPLIENAGEAVALNVNVIAYAVSE